MSAQGTLHADPTDPATQACVKAFSDAGIHIVLNPDPGRSEPTLYLDAGGKVSGAAMIRRHAISMFEERILQKAQARPHGRVPAGVGYDI